MYDVHWTKEERWITVQSFSYTVYSDVLLFKSRLSHSIKSLGGKENIYPFSHNYVH